MSMILNVSIILMLLGGVALLLVFRLTLTKKVVNLDTEEERSRYTIPVIKDYIQSEITNMSMKDLYNSGYSQTEFDRMSRRKEDLEGALQNCNTGDSRSKTYVTELIFDILYHTYDFNNQNVNWVIPFDQPNKMSNRDIFDTLMYQMKREYGDKGLGELLDGYNLSNLKEDGRYTVTEEEIRLVYLSKVGFLTLEDKIQIVAQRIYSHLKGFGVVDEIRDMSIDGVSGGVSGLPRRMETIDDEMDFTNKFQTLKSGLNSVWVMYKGKTIHLEFLNFEHEAELRRVVQNSYKYNFPGQLSENKPFIINEMYDGSRVTVVRPQFSESWAFFIRKKYDMKKLELGQLIQHRNNEIPIQLLMYLMKGNRVTSVTGSQGSGKTTLLMALVEHINKTLNLRIQETSFELNLRSLYPSRNILTFQETDNVSGQDGLDLQKKTDGAVNILGEVATDPVAAWMIQTAQVASLFTIFTHHAKTFPDLVYSLRNSLLKVGMFQNESIAEQQVVSVLEFDVHLQQDYDGSRYIDRITECIPLDNKIEPVEMGVGTREDKQDSLVTVATNYFQQQTQKRHFEERTILEFKNGEYVIGKKMSDARIKEIDGLLSDKDKVEFKKFITDNWG